MHNYLLLVLSLYAILITSAVLAFQLGVRYRGVVPAFILASIAAVLCAISWEGLFALGSLVGVGPYVSTLHTYGYTMLPQPIGLFCMRAAFTVALAFPAAFCTLVLFRRSDAHTVGPRA